MLRRRRRAHPARAVARDPDPRRRTVRGRGPARRRRFADGWIGVWVTPERFATTATAVEASAGAYGRGGVAWRHELLVWCGFGDGRDEARSHLASAMEQLYRLPFEKFERTSPYGTPDDVAGALSAYVDAGVRSFDVIATGADTDRALEGAAAAREQLLLRCR